MMKYVIGAGLPTLNGITSWIKTEGGNAATIVLVCFCVYFLFKQQFGKFVGFLVFAGIVFFSIGSPSSVVNALKAIWELME